MREAVLSRMEECAGERAAREVAMVERDVERLCAGRGRFSYRSTAVPSEARRQCKLTSACRVSRSPTRPCSRVTKSSCEALSRASCRVSSSVMEVKAVEALVMMVRLAFSTEVLRTVRS